MSTRLRASVALAAVARRRLAFAASLGMLVAAQLPGCSRPSTGPSTGPNAVAECEEYQRAFVRCTGIDAGLASQPAAVASTDADRARLAELCSANLQRLLQSCR